MSIRDQILSKEDRKYETLTIPEWDNVKVCMRSLSGEERERWQEGNRDISDPQNIKVVTKDFEIRLVIASMVDPETKEQVFVEADIPSLRLKNGAAINRCYTVAARLSGIGEREMNELAKNLQKGQSEDSTSG